MGVAASDPLHERYLSTFVHGLAKLGWIEGRNIVIERRSAAGLPELAHRFAAELVEIKPQLLVGHTTPPTAALLSFTSTIPVVFVSVGDPLGDGFVASMNRPGRNVTGFSAFEATMGGKWLQLLNEFAPGAKRVAFMFNPDTAPNRGSYYMQTFEAATTSFAVEATAMRVRSVDDIHQAISVLAANRDTGLVVMPEIFTSVHRDVIIEGVNRNRVPAIFPFRYFSTAGGLMSYGIDTVDLWRRAPSYVDQILKGADPADLPVQQPTKFQFVLNLKTANTLGLKIPQSLIIQADEVIE